MQLIKSLLILSDQTQIQTEVINNSMAQMRLVDILNGTMQRNHLGNSQFLITKDPLYMYYRVNPSVSLTSNETLFLGFGETPEWKLLPEDFVLNPSMELYGTIQEERETRINSEQISMAQSLADFAGQSSEKTRSSISMRKAPISIMMTNGYAIDGFILVPAANKTMPADIQRGKKFIALSSPVLYFPPGKTYSYKKYTHLLINSNHIQSFQEPEKTSPLYIENEPPQD